MFIRRIEVTGFLGRDEPLSLLLNEDINIVTGYNGAGKTNLLKIIWYAISGNFYALLDEVSFDTLILATSSYEISVQRISSNTCRGSFKGISGEEYEFEDASSIDDDDVDLFSDARDRFNDVLRPIGSSLFFPTFRRIEGGFTTTGSRGSRSNPLFNTPRIKGELPEAIAAVSRKLSNEGHTFVTSISTVDIAELLLRQYNDMSEEANSLQSSMSQEVIKKIRDFRRETARDDQTRTGQEAVETLDSIKSLIENVDQERVRTMAPMHAVQDLGSKIFKHKGIQINRRVGFGGTVNSINSDLLSAGEKQMLSFICYNAFIDNSPFFIDEPELSLHVDWQRTLLPTLQSQGKSNQFIIATHSPFIYGKYPEKEIRLADDRGGE